MSVRSDKYEELGVATDHNINEWVLSDENQYIRMIAEKVYEVYEIWKGPDQYYISYACINLDDYAKDIEDSLKQIGFTSLEEIQAMYGECTYQILAELFSEQENYENVVETFQSLDESIKYIIKMISQ